MQYHEKKMNVLYFDEEDLKKLFEQPSRAQLEKKILETGTGVEILQDIERAKEFLSDIKIINDKTDIEIFTSLYMLLRFYGGAKIGFILKDSIDVDLPITTISDLKKIIKENDLTDVCLMSGDGLRAFQLKAYKGSDNYDEFLDFLIKKLKHYGNDLGNVNLFVTLQCGGDISNLRFEEIHKKLMGLGIKGGGHILISYNQENKEDVIDTIFPTIGTTRLAHEHIAA
jgi:hypothetical protein